MAWTKKPLEDMKKLVTSLGELAVGLHALQLKQATERARSLSQALQHQAQADKK